MWKPRLVLRRARGGAISAPASTASALVVVALVLLLGDVLRQRGPPSP